MEYCRHGWSSVPPRRDWPSALAGRVPGETRTVGAPGSGRRGRPGAWMGKRHWVKGRWVSRLGRYGPSARGTSRWAGSGRGIPWRVPGLWWLIPLLLLLAFVYWRTWGWIDRRLLPAAATVAASRVEAMGTETIGKAVRPLLSQSGYDSVVRIVQAGDGKVAYLTVNGMAVSRLQLEVALRVQEALLKLDGATVLVPVGPLVGFGLWAARGPAIPVRLRAVGNVKVDFYSQFQEAGINQSLHQVGMDVEATMRLVLPRREEPIRWQVRLPLGEALIAGQVPSVYAGSTTAAGGTSPAASAEPKGGGGSAPKGNVQEKSRGDWNTVLTLPLYPLAPPTPPVSATPPVSPGPAISSGPPVSVDSSKASLNPGSGARLFSFLVQVKG